LRNLKFKLGFNLSRTVVLSYIILSIILYASLSISELPDYEAYKKIYESFALILSLDWEPFFVGLNLLGKYLNLNYDQFRLLIFSLSIIITCLSILLFQEKNKVQTIETLSENTTNRIELFLIVTLLKILIYLIFAFAVTTFFFEFYMVRIRAGLAVSFFLIGFAMFYTIDTKYRKVVYLFALLFIFVGILSHQSTSIILAYLIFLPFIFTYFNKTLYAFRKGKKTKYLILFVFILFSFIFQSILINSISDRGEHLFSPLNPVRFIALTVPPVLIYFYFYFNTGSLSLKNKTQNLLTNKILPNNGNNEIIRFRHVFHHLLTINYLILLITLSVYYALGFVGNAGEALVRIYTLGSVVSILVLQNSSKQYFYFWFYVLLSNSLFFINTIYGN
jgi:hypothetical protein